MVKQNSKRYYFPLLSQYDTMDCGPTCLRMISSYYGKTLSASHVKQLCHVDKAGVSLKGISHAASKIGFRTISVKVSFEESEDSPGLIQAPLPLIAHWDQNHFIVVYRISKRYVWIADPAGQKIRLKKSDFLSSWLSEGNKGVAMLLELTPDFYKIDEDGDNSKRSFLDLGVYLRPHKKLLGQIGLGMLISAILTLLSPFLTQSIVDIGISLKDLEFIYVILLGQLMLFFGQITIKFVQAWILLRISSHVSISLIHDFLSKLMRLPIGFFDSKMTGDLMQRINDHHRIESFLTSSTISVILSVFNLIMFGLILAWYSSVIFTAFVFSSILYLSWILFFLRKRKEVDYLSFQHQTRNQDSLLEIIHGMPEIMLQNSRQKRRNQWLEIQIKLLQVQIKGLKISQYQEVGGLGINQLKDIFITFFAAKAVMEGKMTLGTMLAIQYIVGQLNYPLHQLIAFLQSAQEAQLSFERLSEVHAQNDETGLQKNNFLNLPDGGDISIKNVYFRYNPLQKWVLEDLNISFPRGKTTAIVGSSGSGKTTLLKLLLGFYNPEIGNIYIGNTPLVAINPDVWREACGAVLQDGYLFSDTIENNIAECTPTPDSLKIVRATSIANLGDYISTLPLGTKTMIGARGNGLSQGQKQRLLIARAIYKDPDFIFFDEATNALDAKNEREIVAQLGNFSFGKTVVIIAHRLSTVKNADQIVVLEKGRIAEIGTHDSLTKLKGVYYSLVKNQLEL